MYGGKVPTAVAAGAPGAAVLPNTGGPSTLWLVVGILAVIIGLFALLMATGAAARLVPAGVRRKMRRTG